MKFLKPLLLTLLAGGVFGLLALTSLYFYIKPELPSVSVLKDVRLQTPMKIYSQDGLLISQFGVKRRIPLSLDDVPDTLIHAVLATEDSRFYEHPGIDPIGMARAVVNLVLTGEKGQGGSTLTMQLARGFFLTREKTYIRKLKEIFIAWHMEQVLTKDEILALYLNKIELGHRAFGFGAAAQVYYGKDVSELTLAQIATIAGLPKAPSTLNPISNPERSLERRKVVLLRMLDERYISPAEFEAAANAPVTAKKHGAEIELDAPYLADLIYNEMVELYGKEEAETGGYQVYATVPSRMQKAAQQAVVRNLHDYDERHGYRGPIDQLWTPLDAEEGQDPDLVTHSLDNPAWNESQMLDRMAQVQPIGSLRPAVVTRVSEQSIMVFDNQASYRLIDWDGLMWARPYIDDSHQGEEPKTASDIVTEGALVWIRQRQDDQIWQLSQFPRASGALVALDPFDGAAKAVVGGYSFYESQFNRATQAKRQVGSNIKPFIYSAALENGYTLASVINDAPINQWDARTGVAWRPQNSPAIYDGPIRMRIALGKSKNVVSIRLLRAIGIDAAVEHLTKFGFVREEIPRDETLSLGSGSHTPLEVVTGMATIANGGFAVQPYFIERIANEMGDTLWVANPSVACDDCALTAQTDVAKDDIEARLAAEFGLLDTTQSRTPDREVRQAPRVISAQNAFLVKEMMRTAVRGNGRYSEDPEQNTYWVGTGWRARNLLQRTDLAGKTGTTNDSKDAWFSGFSPHLVATTWVGFDDMSRTLGRASRNQNLINANPSRFNWIGNAMIGAEDGAKAAQPAWIRFMQVALDGVPEEAKPVPDGIITVRIDRDTGKLTNRTDRTALFEYFIEGTEPTVYAQPDEPVDPFVEDDTPRRSPAEDEIF
ncbi:penicillin-binding protein 1A [Aestuariibacter halophilus]|uniref:Penicillin-binding protein 1A n=1 Tax=Fluctibacter halophilus TaxID=226011 RepID=A0ABS8GA18_9ALTE|nr:penicillin-binding protein 1A [Aestuariibacter halophilus]MCC2617375.1 penicillin-binding protein 1A [Aestuariibacter halophilus]